MTDANLSVTVEVVDNATPKFDELSVVAGAPMTRCRECDATLLGEGRLTHLSNGAHGWHPKHIEDRK